MYDMAPKTSANQSASAFSDLGAKWIYELWGLGFGACIIAQQQ